MAKFILANKSISNAATAVDVKNSRDGGLGPKLAGIIREGSGGLSRQNFHQKTAQNPHTLAAFSDYSTIAQGFVSSLQNFSAFDGMLSSCVPVR